MPLNEKHLWEVGKGGLYALTLNFSDDEVTSYFGLREVDLSDGVCKINGKPVFQRLILDQGFYPDGIYTAPTKEALKNDILLSMKVGFNGARLHQKIFEPLFLHYCDELGYIVWGEHGNWGLNWTKFESLRYFLLEIEEEIEVEIQIGDTEINMSEVSSNINNSYLQVNGLEEGVASYDHVTDLLLAHYYSNKNK